MLFIQPEVAQMLVALGYVDDGENLLFPYEPTALQSFDVALIGYDSLLQARMNQQRADPKNLDKQELNEAQCTQLSH